MVVLPADCRDAVARLDGRRLDRLAQAVCGCWVVRLPDSGVWRLLWALMAGDGVGTEQEPHMSGGR